MSSRVCLRGGLESVLARATRSASAARRSPLSAAAGRGRYLAASSLLPTSATNATASDLYKSRKSQSMIIGGGSRIFTNGSGIGTDSSMIAANDRCGPKSVDGGGNRARSFASRSSAEAARGGWGAVPGVTSHLATPRTLGEASYSPSSPLLSRTSGARRFSADVGKAGGMDDEYGEMTSEGSTYVHPVPFVLESGEVIHNAQLKYKTYGELNEARDNALVVCHALTGNASLHAWWGDLLGPGQAFDTSEYFVVCANILGSCYGSTSPASPIPRVADDGAAEGGEAEEKKKKEADDESVDADIEGETYGFDFPDVSVQDTVRLQLHMLQDDLRINSVKCVVGGSFGGMQAVEYAAQAGSVSSPFAVDDPSGRAVPFVRSVVPIACGAAHTAWQIAISETQRQAIYADPKWNGGRPDPTDPPLSGLSVARQIGMVSYRTAKGYEKKFGRKLKEKTDPPYGSRAPWQVKSYLEYQGYKFLSRFDAVTYVKLTQQMDTHDVGRNRGGKAEALSGVKIPALVLGIDSDVLYPLHEQEELAGLFPNGRLGIIESEAGHDGFLLEQDQVAAYIAEFLAGHD